MVIAHYSGMSIPLQTPLAANLRWALMLAAVYTIAGKLGLMAAFVHASATAVWPPTGIALAAILIFGYRAAAGIFLGAFLVNISTAGTTMTSVGIAFGNTLEAVLGAALVNRYANAPHSFDRPADVYKWMMLAALLSTMVSPLVGVSSLVLGGVAEAESFWPIWLTWWLGDAVGALIVAPPLVLWRLHPRVQWSRNQWLEVLLSLLVLCLVSMIVFMGWLPAAHKNYPLEYLCLPVLVWIAFRFGPRETATATLVLSSMALGGTLNGYGPFARATPHESVLLLQTFMGATAILALGFAAVVKERLRAEEKRKKLLMKLQIALDQLKTLRGLLPICASCKKVRNDEGYWDQIEHYIEARSQATFSHGMCPECMEKWGWNRFVSAR
jgi:integral membrane sensor domain MASE1